MHPTDAMPPSGVALMEVALNGLPPALASLLPEGVRTAAAGPPLQVTLSTPRGVIVLPSPNAEANDVQL